ncbi:MAG: SprT family zinc-dependent metalloprotease [Pseudomonadota bacterium]
MSRAPVGIDPSQQLSLFDDAPPAPVSTAAPQTPVRNEQAASAAASPGDTIRPGGLTPAVFRHPRAERELRLGEHLVAYAFRRARRRSIGFAVGPEGLAVSAPRWVTMTEVESALHEKSGWILRKLREQRERAQRMESRRIEWRDGASVPFLGEQVIVVLDPRAIGAVLNAAGEALPGVPRLVLHVGLPQSAAPEQIRDTVQSWLQRQARRVFEERCAHFAQALNVRVRKLSLSSAQTRWGSASADGSIRLHWRLIHFALPVIDYVVAHELAHLREMNHSPAFWDVVRSVLPDYERHRSVLKDDALPAFD